MGELTERLDKGEIGITLENGTTLRVGERYTLDWKSHEYIKVLAFGENKIFAVDQQGDEDIWDINYDWIPYTEPKEEPKPFEGYQKWYIHLSGKSNRVRIEYMTIAKSLELRKSTHILGVYTETEAIELGLPI